MVHVDVLRRAWTGQDELDKAQWSSMCQMSTEVPYTGTIAQVCMRMNCIRFKNTPRTIKKEFINTPCFPINCMIGQRQRNMGCDFIAALYHKHAIEPEESDVCRSISHQHQCYMKTRGVNVLFLSAGEDELCERRVAECHGAARVGECVGCWGMAHYPAGATPVWIKPCSPMPHTLCSPL